MSYFPQEMKGIGAMELPKPARAKLAKESIHWKCTLCGENCSLLEPKIVQPKEQQQAVVVPEQIKEAEPVENVQQPNVPEQQEAEVVPPPTPVKIQATKKPLPKRAAQQGETKAETILNSLIALVLMFIAMVLMNKVMRNGGLEEV